MPWYIPLSKQDWSHQNDCYLKINTSMAPAMSTLLLKWTVWKFWPQDIQQYPPSSPQPSYLNLHPHLFFVPPNCHLQLSLLMNFICHFQSILHFPLHQPFQSAVIKNMLERRRKNMMNYHIIVIKLMKTYLMSQVSSNATSKVLLFPTPNLPPQLSLSHLLLLHHN